MCSCGAKKVIWILDHRQWTQGILYEVGIERYLLPAGSEEHGALQTESIHVAILSSCQIPYNSAL